MSGSVAEMTTTTEEPGEQIERVVAASACRAALTVLLNALVAILVVDFACGRGGEDIVGVCDLDKFLARSFISTISE